MVSSGFVSRNSSWRLLIPFKPALSKTETRLPIRSLCWFINNFVRSCDSFCCFVLLCFSSTNSQCHQAGQVMQGFDAWQQVVGKVPSSGGKLSWENVYMCIFFSLYKPNTYKVWSIDNPTKASASAALILFPRRLLCFKLIIIFVIIFSLLGYFVEVIMTLGATHRKDKFTSCSNVRLASCVIWFWDRSLPTKKRVEKKL